MFRYEPGLLSAKSHPFQLALFSPEDVAVDPVALCQHLALIAKDYGALIYENNPVTEVHIGDEKQVYGVSTKMGFIETSHFVDAAGIVSCLNRISHLKHTSSGPEVISSRHFLTNMSKPPPIRAPIHTSTLRSCPLDPSVT